MDICKFKDMSPFNEPGLDTENYEAKLATCLSQWARIYETYMRCQLTHQSDRIMALAGAAEEIRGLLNVDYLAGQWRFDFEAQLTWRVKDHTHAQRATPYRAPTWSWLSIDGEIVPPDHAFKSKTIIEVLDIAVELANPHRPAGEIKSGVIKANAHLRPLSWRVTETSHPEISIGNQPVLKDGPRRTFDIFFDTLDTFRQENQIRSYLCPLELGFYTHEYRWIGGLILVPTNGDSISPLRRIGAFKAFDAAVCQLLQHQKCKGLGCKFENLGESERILPPRHEIPEWHRRLRPEDARIRAELEASYMQGLQLTRIEIV